MEAWVERALAKWPNVPAVYGWMGLDRKGRWLIRGELITRPQIIDTINRNYGVDEHGNWYFQNGPQRGYVSLACAPFVLHAQADGSLRTHTDEPVTRIEGAWLDEEGALLLKTPQGPALLADADVAWALERLHAADGGVVDEQALAHALALPSGARTSLRLHFSEESIEVQRLDEDAAPAALGFVREPQPR